jgi:hypothetical protein
VIEERSLDDGLTTHLIAQVDHTDRPEQETYETEAVGKLIEDR